VSDIAFITGNQHKADYLAKWLGIPMPHQKVDLEELQSLDLREVVEHKVRGAYAATQKPVLVEDVALTFHGMGRLPGTFIKWFLEELGAEGICRLATTLADKTATASIMYALYDGQELHTFEGHVHGTIAPQVRSLEGNDWKSAKSWNSLFIPDGSTKTYAEMTDEELESFSHRAQAIAKLRTYLQNLDITSK
jgi:non-canonical purine NTP pyrophosphatase (RdgB/HAM1 family)